MQLTNVNGIITDINREKEKILCEIIEQIEGRPATRDDFKNLTLVNYPANIHDSLVHVIYKNIAFGTLGVKIQGFMVTISFNPDNAGTITMTGDIIPPE